MPDLHLRIDQELSDTIDTLKKARPGATRSDIAKYLMAAGIEATRGGLASVHEALSRMASELEAQQQLAISTTVGLAEQLARDAGAARGALDLANRVAIETMMILRQFAVAKDPAMLPAAQARAREFYTSKINGHQKPPVTEPRADRPG